MGRLITALRWGNKLDCPFPGEIELLLVNAIDAGHELETKEVAEGKAHLALAMGIHIGFINRHLGAMSQNALDHGGDLGGRTAFELGIDAKGLLLHMPVDHDAPSFVAGMPLGH